MEPTTLTGVVVKEESGYSALCLELDVASQGSTVEESKTMLLEAVSLYLEGTIEDGLPYSRQVPSDEDPHRLAPDDVVETFIFEDFLKLL